MSDLRVCVLGDSYVLGQGDDTGLGWTGRVLSAARRSGAGLTLYNLGVRGETGPEIAARTMWEIEPRLRVGDKRAVILAFGTNDISRGVPMSESVTAAGQIAGWCGENGFDTFILSPPAMPYDPGRDAKSAELALGLAALGAPFLNLREIITDWSLWWEEAAAGDGAHPNGEGYALVAEAFMAWAPWQEWLGLQGAPPLGELSRSN